MNQDDESNYNDMSLLFQWKGKSFNLDKAVFDVKVKLEER